MATLALEREACLPAAVLVDKHTFLRSPQQVALDALQKLADVRPNRGGDPSPSVVNAGGVKKGVRKLWYAICPDIKPCITSAVGRELWYDYLSPSDCTDRLRNVSIHIGNVIMLAGAQRTTPTNDSMVACAIQWLSTNLVLACILAAAWHESAMVVDK